MHYVGYGQIKKKQGFDNNSIPKLELGNEVKGHPLLAKEGT
jgi:hypothetical protein